LFCDVGFSFDDGFFVVDYSEITSLFVGASVDSLCTGFARCGIDAFGTTVKLDTSTAGTLSIAFFAEFSTPGASYFSLMTFNVVAMPFIVWRMTVVIMIGGDFLFFRFRMFIRTPMGTSC